MSIKKVKNPGSNETKWEIRVYEDGRDSKRVCKRFDRRVDAEVWLLEFEQKKAERIRNPFSSVSFENRTFQDEAEYWLLAGENRFSAGHVKKSKAIVKEILKAFGVLPIERISPEFLTRYQQSELKKGAQPATINRKTEVVTAVLNNSVKHRRIPFNPTMGFRKLSKNQKEMDFWNKDEAESFLSFIDEIYPKGSDDRWVYAVYLLALNTGLRAGEIWGLRPQDILEGHRSITVKRQFNRVTLDFTAPKSKKPRVVPCNQVLLNELKSWIDQKKMSPADTIFQNENGKPICHDNFTDRRFQGSPSMTGAVRESARMVLPQTVLAKGAPNAPERARTYHWITGL